MWGVQDDGVASSGPRVAVAAALLLIAAVLRFRALGTTLFEDEVWVANLLRDGNYAPHTYATPPLFYAAGRLWVALRGMSDAALREPAAIFGVALCAVPLVAPRPWRVRLIWSALFAFSSPLLFYSARLKQYTLEAFAVTTLIVLFLHAWERERWLPYFAAAIAFVLTLHSPVFIVAASGAVALLMRRRLALLAGFAVAGAAFALAWLAYMAPGPATPRLHGDMDVFFRETGRWVDSATSLLWNTAHWLGQAFNLVPFWWLIVPALAGWWLWRARDWEIVLLAALPPLAVVIASVARLYPYGEVRLMIFCFPALYLLVAESLEHAARRTALVLLVLVPFAFNGTFRDTYNATYMQVDDLRPLIDTVRRGHRAGEPIYADPSYAAPLDYYVPEARADLRSVIVSAPSARGWYVQQASRFRAPEGLVVARTKHVIAARVP